MIASEMLRVVLTRYNLGDAQIELLRDYENLMYRIDADRRYALRICAANVDLGRLRAEVNWLAAIRSETDLLVPKPVPNIDEALISQVEDRFCVLFEWLDGQAVGKEMSPSIARQIGERMAKLHQQALHYQPEVFAGARYDYDCFFGPDSWWHTRAAERLSSDYQRMEPSLNKAKTLLQTLGTASPYFGMIHSDIHFGNVLQTPNGLAIIDFGDCGMGYYLLDIAVTEAEFQDYDEAKALIDSFREGYQSVHSVVLRSADIRLFGILASLLFFEWVFESENEQVYQDKSQWISGMVAEIAAVERTDDS